MSNQCSLYVCVLGARMLYARVHEIGHGNKAHGFVPAPISVLHPDSVCTAAQYEVCPRETLRAEPVLSSRHSPQMLLYLGR